VCGANLSISAASFLVSRCIVLSNVLVFVDFCNRLRWDYFISFSILFATGSLQ
jgi:hypothetical protein